MDNERIPCKKCGALILPATFAKNDGLCALCERGIEKKICDLCGKVANGIIKLPNGKTICLKCNMSESEEISDKWKTLYNKESYPYDLESILIKPYPEFEEVFANKDLKGIFYPLCSIKMTEKETNQQILLHFISHNGLWIDETRESDTLNNIYSKFEIVNNRYLFKGDLSALKTILNLKEIFSLLSSFFEKDKEKWLKGQARNQDFVKEASAICKLTTSDFDLKYFIETFFSYYLRKEKYMQKYDTCDFVPLKSLSQDDLFEPITSNDFKSMAEELVVNNTDLLMNLIPIGACWGYEYFFDGNNSFLFFDKAKSQIYSVNQYD